MAPIGSGLWNVLQAVAHLMAIHCITPLRRLAAKGPLNKTPRCCDNTTSWVFMAYAPSESTGWWFQPVTKLCPSIFPNNEPIWTNKNGVLMDNDHHDGWGEAVVGEAHEFVGNSLNIELWQHVLQSGIFNLQKSNSYPGNGQFLI